MRFVLWCLVCCDVVFGVCVLFVFRFVSSFHFVMLCVGLVFVCLVCSLCLGCLVVFWFGLWCFCLCWLCFCCVGLVCFVLRGVVCICFVVCVLCC